MVDRRQRWRRIAFASVLGLVVFVGQACSSSSNAGAGWTFGPTLAPASVAPGSSPAPVASAAASTAPVASGAP